MVKLVNYGLLAGFIFSSSAGALASGWGYNGSTGPKHWEKLNEAYALCGSGKNQSPVNLSDFAEAELGALGLSYTHPAKTFLNNGHTVQANFGPGDTLDIDGRTYELKQFHFHTPSENHIDGQSFPLEAHLVHADKSGNLAVVAVMFKEGERNETLAKLWAQMPREEGTENPLKETVTAAEILPADRNYYRFNGSLTTPPCTEGVKWFVMKTPVTISSEQVSAISETFGHPNNRPVQPLNARKVLK